MRTLRVFVPLLLAAVVAVGGAPSASAATVCASADALPVKASAAKLANAAACLVNQERTRRHLRPLRLNGKLGRAAKRHARDMVARNYFSHDTQGGGDFAARIHKAGFLGFTLGEDLACGSGTLGTARAIVAAWMGSAEHRRNILDPHYRVMGMGAALGMPGGD